MTNYALTAAAGAFTLVGVNSSYRGEARVADGVISGDANAYTWLPDGTLTDTLLVGDSATLKAIYDAQVNEGALFGELMRFGMPVAIVDNVNIAEATTVLRGLLVLEGLKLTDTLDPSARYGVAIAEAISMSDALQAFFGATIQDGLILSDTIAANFLQRVQITETMTLQDTLAPSLLMRVDLADNIEIDDGAILKMIFDGRLGDTVVLASFVSPDGGITTWAINSRTGSVTEYRNFSFSSFAQLGNTFVAAGPGGDGLYLLEGQRDDGSNIVARMRGGTLELNGSRFVSFKGAYLGLRVKDDGEEFLLKLIDPAGREYVYKVRARDMRTTKVHMGKGLRARYWQWELTSLAADFDLDTIEFVPLTPARRV